LWQLAENALPTRHIKTAMPRYSQALMDLGATLCLPRQPNCQACPVRQECKAFALGEPEKFPVKTRKIKRSSEVLWLLLAQNTQGQVWLEKRPPKGIWASLYSLPLFDSEASLHAVFEHNAKPKKLDTAAATTSSAAMDLEVLPAFKHVLTHKDLHCHVVKVRLKTTPLAPNAGAWFAKKDWVVLGLPTPVRHLLSNSL
jgi:A/G-specific adenine glycosylase